MAGHLSLSEALSFKMAPSDSPSEAEPIHPDSKPIDFVGRSDQSNQNGKLKRLTTQPESSQSQSQSQSQSEAEQAESSISQAVSNPQLADDPDPLNNQCINSSSYPSDPLTSANPSSPPATFGSFTSTPPTGRLSLDDNPSSSFSVPQQQQQQVKHRRNQLSQSSSLFNPLQEEVDADSGSNRFSSGSGECDAGQSYESCGSIQDHDYFNHHSSSLATTAATSYSLSPPRILNFSRKGKGKAIEIESDQEVGNHGEKMIGENSNEEVAEGSNQDLHLNEHGQDFEVGQVLEDQEEVAISAREESMEASTEVTVSPIDSSSPSSSDEITRRADQCPTVLTHPGREVSLPPEYLNQETPGVRDTVGNSQAGSTSIPLDYAQALADGAAWRRTRSTRNDNNSIFASSGELPPYANDETHLPGYHPSNLNPNPSPANGRRFFGSSGRSHSRFRPSMLLRRMVTTRENSNYGVAANPPTSSFDSFESNVSVSASSPSSRRPFVRAGSAPSLLATERFTMGPRLGSGASAFISERHFPPLTSVPTAIGGVADQERPINGNGRTGRRSSLFSDFRQRVRESRRSSINSNPFPNSNSALQSPCGSRPMSVRSSQSRPSSSAGWSVNGSLMTNGSRPQFGSSASAFRFPNPAAASSHTTSRPTSSHGIGTSRPPFLKHHAKSFSLRSLSDVLSHVGASSRVRDRRVSTSSVPADMLRSGSTAASEAQHSVAVVQNGSRGMADEQNCSNDGQDSALTTQNQNQNQNQHRLSTVHPSPDLRPQQTGGDLDTGFQLIPTQSRIVSRKSPNVSSIGERPSLLRQGYSAPMASTSLNFGQGLYSLQSDAPKFPKKDLFDLILPREVRIHIFARLVQLHEDDFLELLEKEEFRGKVARENVWVGKEKGIRELVRISRVSKTWQSLVLDGQLWQEMDISEFPSISERALISIARSAGPFVKELNLNGLSNLPSTALIALTQAHAGEIHPSDPIHRPQGISNQASSSNARQITPRSASVGHIDLGSSSLLNSSEAVTRLTTLKLRGCFSISRPALHHLLAKSPELKELSLSDLSIVEDETLGLLSRKNLKIQTLDLSRCRNITGEGVKCLGNRLEEMKKLRAVGLKEVSDSMMSSISEGMTKLEILNLSYSDITDSNVESLISTSSNEPSDSVVELTPREAGGDLSSTSMHFKKRLNLKHLALSACRALTDRGLIHLAHSVPKLEVLELANIGVNLTDRGLVKLIETIPLIKRLDLEGAAEITEITIEALTPPSSFTDSNMAANRSSFRAQTRTNPRASASNVGPRSSRFNADSALGAFTSNLNLIPPAIPGSQLTHLILSHASRIDPDSISILISRAPFLRHLHLDDTRCGDSIAKVFVKILKEREVQNGLISLIDCRSITRSTCNEINNGGNVRPRMGRRGYEFNSYLYDDDDTAAAVSTSSDRNRNGGLDECNPSKVVFKSFWSWQNVDNRLKSIRKKEAKSNKKKNQGLNGSRNPNGRQLGEDGLQSEESGRWNRLTSVISLEEDDDARNCTIM